MSFQNSTIWLHNESGSLANDQMQFNTYVRMDQKRGYQWLMDVSEQELPLNKKRAIDPVKYTSEPAALNSSLWRHVSEPQRGSPAGDHLFCPKPVRSPYVFDKTNPSTNPTFVNIEEDFQNQFGNHSSNRVSMSHAVEDPLSLNTGHREVEVNKTSISENCLTEFVGNSFCPGEKGKLTSAAADPRTAINMFPLTAYNSADGISISENPALQKMDKSFLSVGSASSTSNSSLMITHPFYDGIDNNGQSIGQAFNRRNYNVNTLGEQYVKENNILMPISRTGHGNLFSKNPFYNKINEAFASAGSAYNAGDRNISICGQQDATVVSVGALDNHKNSSILSMVENSKKGLQTNTTISFGGFQENHEERDHLGRLINGYSALLSQSSAQLSGQQVSAEHLSANVISAATSRAHNPQKNKEKVKKGLANNFPANVKSLLSTGILNDVPVKYVSWSREKNLRGVVRGTGYLCGCQDCNLSRVVNAYEFERHAGCKTKHPNNHIYFENGKTIYAVVQELKATPQESLFEVMQTVTGSPVNQKNFNIWKASYQAATRELQRIYANEEMTVQS